MTTEPKAPNPSPRARKTRTARQKPKVRMVKRAREEGDNPGTGHWRVYFLEHLIETSNISASARHAGTIPSRAYRTRKHDPLFAAAWDAALIEGYKNLEMDVLAYLRNPSPEHKMDVASAIRLLTLHRQARAQDLARDEECSEQEALEALDSMLEQMRQRAAANALEDDDAGEAGR
ncbi:hypothetical protein [Novosphingobium sp.]|uniref:hypothetical protein n=1 Tax=Novosphingobium sp. TaxID=1874826 RepID=UPI0025F02759|nr:hypothetical protein [Novosphingobium sp.]MCC6926125.1 hypothetical protein [Novosphingobium sp.]